MRKILKCCARKSYQISSGKTGDQRLYPIQEIRAISRTNKTTSTLFRYQKAVPIDACHGVCYLSYDNHFYNGARLNQSTESMSRNRKETTRSALIHQKFLKKSHLGKKKFSKFSFSSPYSFVSTQYKNISGIKQSFIQTPIFAV